MQDPYTHHTNWPRVIGFTLLVIGILALIVGAIYLTIPAHSLPSVLGRLPHQAGHRSRRGYGGVVVGVVCAVVGGILVVRTRRPD
jgi:energy-converting hydrogenase Eha subunit C